MRLAILDDYQNIATSLADWEQLAVERTVFTEPFADRAAVAEALAPFDIVVAMRERTPFDAWTLGHLPRLRLLVTTGMRNASIDLAAASAQGIAVCGTEGSVGATAELTWGLILALTRHLPGEIDRLRRGGRWQETIGDDLRGRCLGIVGLGQLGQRVARVGLAFGMEVVAWSRSLSRERCDAIGVGLADSLAALLGRADIVSLHATLNPQSRGLIGAAELARMKPGALLINTARGPLVDEAALIAALESRRIAGAGLDVFDQEPLPPDHPLRRLDNVVATPHLGYVTRDTYRIFYGQAVEDIAAWIAGRRLRPLN